MNVSRTDSVAVQNTPILCFILSDPHYLADSALPIII